MNTKGVKPNGEGVQPSEGGKPNSEGVEPDDGGVKPNGEEGRTQ